MKLLVAFILFITSSLESFTNLEQAYDFALNHKEFPPIENSSVLNPSYINWYRAHNKSLWNKMLTAVGFKEKTWSANDFSSLLISLLALREKQGTSAKHIAIHKALAGTKFILFGPLYGSFHSLVRNLQELVKLGYIDQNLKLRKDNIFIVFCGNVIDRSAYGLETLTLVLSLMKLNPKNIYYLQGQHEYDKAWENYTLKQELNIKVANSAIEFDVARFFLTLPLELIIVGPHDSGLIKISAFDENELKIDERKCSWLIDSSKEGSSQVCRLFSQYGEGDLPWTSIIKSENRLMSYKNHYGLLPLSLDQGISLWSIFSAPNLIFKKYFDFEYDAFAILSIGSTLENSTISLYNQDIRNQDGFKKSAEYMIVSQKLLTPNILLPSSLEVYNPSKELKNVIETCKKTSFEKIKEEPVNKNPIIIGCTLDLTKGISGLGKEIKAGISLAVSNQNRLGGINGQLIKVIYLDDGYSPERARKNVLELIKKYGSILLLCPPGSATLQAYTDLLEADKAFVFFPITGAPIFRTEKLRNIVHWRASYISEGKILTKYTIEKNNLHAIGYFYQNDSYGLGALQGAHLALNEKGIKDFIDAPYERNTTTFEYEIKKIRDANVQALGFFSTAIAATEFIRQASIPFFIGKKLFALSDLSEENFKKFARTKGLDITIAQATPNPLTSTMQIAKDFRYALESQGYSQKDAFMFEAYIGAQLALYILKNIKGQLTFAKIRAFIASLHNHNFKGLNLSFNPKTHELAHYLWLDIGTNQWIMKE